MFRVGSREGDGLLAVSILSLVALVFIGGATVWIAIQTRAAAQNAVEFAKTTSRLERLDRVSRALEALRDLIEGQENTIRSEGVTGAHYRIYMDARRRAQRELDQSLNRVAGPMELLPLSVRLVLKSADTLTPELLAGAIDEAKKLVYDVADPGHPSRAPVDGD